MESIDADELEPFARALAAGMGAPEDIAGPVAESLTLANLRGHNSHGVRRLPSYADLAAGDVEGRYTLDPAARPEVTVDRGAFAQVDGRFGFGQYVGRTAVDLAIEKAREHAVAMVGIRDATHLGRIGEWSERVADAGLTFAAFVNAQGPGTVALPGSAQRRLGTDPFSFGVPTFDVLEFPIVLDMATSQCANGKLMERQATGEAFPDEWAVGTDGDPVTDPEAFWADGAGAQRPLGGEVAGHKGFGLAVVAELFASTMGDGFVVGQTDYTRGNAALFVAMDPLVATTRAAFEERIAALAAYVEETEFSPAVSTGPVAAGDRAMLPGEPEHRTTAERREDGIPTAEEDVVALCDLAHDLGVPEAIPPSLERYAPAGD